MPYRGLFELRSRMPGESAASQVVRRLVPVLYVVSALAFISDLQRDNTLAYGIIYTPLIATAVFHERRSGLWMLSTIACVLVIVGAFIPVINSDLPDMIGNRILSIAAIIATAAFVHHARDNQDRLAAETRRAEAAERMKTDVLTTLSEEIRSPMHTMLGVLTLTMATSRPEQREVIGRVQVDTKQLLARIDNLIDLSQLDERGLRRQPVDMALIARETTESAGLSARARQVNVALDVHGDPSDTAAVGDPWAIRRILDNLLANSVRLTPPGGTVSVSVTRSEGMITASVSDTGRGLPPELTMDFRDDAPATDGSALPETGGAGLALSSRLARSMDGRLTARNQLGSGAVVSLCLPAVTK